MERKKASDFPQPLLDLFHEYVHGDIDRRLFLLLLAGHDDLTSGRPRPGAGAS